MFNKFCQSCGMPLSKDPQGGGTEKNKTKSTLYCSHCYQRGAFTEPRLTCKQMVEKVRVVLKQMGVPRWLAWFFLKRIPSLARWQKKK